MVFCSTIVCFTSKVMCLQMMRGVLQCFFVWSIFMFCLVLSLVYILYIFCSSCVWVFDCVHQSVLSWEKMRRDPSTNTICTETMKPCSGFGTYKHKDQIKQLFSLCVNCQATPFGSTQVGDRQIVRKHVIFCKRCT